MKTLIKRGLVYSIVLMLLVLVVSTLAPYTAKAATQTFYLPTEVYPVPVNFINSSFQQPDISTIQSGWLGTANQWMLIPQAEVPGWNTYPVNASDLSSPYAFMIEINRVAGASQLAPTPADGNAYAELNGNVVSRLYQVVNTVPGSKLYWQFAHRASNSSTGADVLNFYLRPSGTPTIAPTSAQLIKTASDTKAAWGYYRGAYTVPAGQTSTEFDFVSVSSSSGSAILGNYLDDITLQTGSSLVAKKSITTSAADGTTALKGEIVTITVQITNWGETDASRCVFRDILSDGLDYVANSATINGAAAGTLATYNSSTDEVRVNFGTGATAGTLNTNGGVLSGSKKLGTSGTTHKGETATITFQAIVTGNSGDVVKNQSSVTYNDSNYESYNTGDYTAYSSVLGQNPVSGNIDTYANKFTIIQRQITGDAVVWVDANEDGNIGATEHRLSGQTVILYNKITGAPAVDVNGNTLTTVTDANGNYTFNLIPQGQYYVGMAVPTGYRVSRVTNAALPTVSTTTATTQGIPNNDAVQSGTVAKSGLIDLSTALTASTPANYVHNLDFGFVPLWQIKKDALIGGTAMNGTALAPQEVTPDQTMTYRVTLTNTATNAADTLNKAITVTDVVPTGLTITGAPTASSGNASVSGQTVTWQLTSLPMGVTTLDIPVKVTPTQAGLLQNTATALDNTVPETLTSNSTYHQVLSKNFTLSKTVGGLNPTVNQAKSFTFGLTFLKSDGTPVTGTYQLAGSGAAANGGQITLVAGKATVTLMHGQTLTVQGLPRGTQYTAAETLPADLADVGAVKKVSTTIAVTNETVGGGQNTGTTSTATRTATGQLVTDNATAAYTNIVTDRIISGTVWGDSDKDNNIGASETKMAGRTVSLMNAATGAVVATTTTDANGLYAFNVTDPGRYYVVTDLPTGYMLDKLAGTVTVGANSAAASTQGTPNNDAILANGMAQIGVIDLRGNVDASTYAYYALNADFGFSPKITTTKHVYAGNVDLAATPGATPMADQTTVAPGDPITYVIALSNPTTTTADVDAVVSDSLPAKFVYVSHAPTLNSNYDSTARKVTWNLLQVTGKASEADPPKMTYLYIHGTVGTDPGPLTNQVDVNIGGDKETITDPTTLVVLSNKELTVGKQVGGTSASITQDFEMKILLTKNDDTPLAGPITYTGLSTVSGVAAPAGGSLTLVNGVATIRLKHGQAVKLAGLPATGKYTITETAVSGYTASYGAAALNADGSVGMVKAANGTAGSVYGSTLQTAYAGDAVSFINVTGNPVTPTGVWMNLWPFLLIGLLGLGGLITLLIRRKKQGRIYNNGL